MVNLKECSYLVASLLLVGCSLSVNPDKEFDEDNSFPNVRNIESYNETVFLPTLESTFKSNINGVYAASLLYAWDVLRNEIKLPIVEIQGDALHELNESESFKNVLNNDEFFCQAYIEGDIVFAKAYFKKSLPFQVPLKKNEDPLIFENAEVSSFGFEGSNDASGIIYFNDDNDFALKLCPEDRQHEIILVKSSFAGNITLATEVQRLLQNQKRFKEIKSEKNNWKYHFNDNDQVEIPIIEFHIDANYNEIEGSIFKTDSNLYQIERAYQRTAFILNENGAEVESEAAMVAVSEEMVEELPRAKNLIFDKPFLIMLRRTDNENPYFALFVSNAELMQLYEEN